MPVLRCLFCNHINPTEASFCNACGSQMDLQPCGQCGAVDSRTASRCHKCETPFTPRSASDCDALLSPQPHGDVRDYSSPIEASVAGAKAMSDTQDQPRPLNYSLSTVAVVAANASPQPTKSRSGWLVPGVAGLAVVVAAIFAIFYQRPAATVPMQAATQVVANDEETPTATPAAPAPAPPTPMTPAPNAQADPVAEAVPAQKLPITPAAVADSPRNVPARVAPRTAPIFLAPPRPVTNSLPPAHRAPPPIKNCSPEAATLGLCNP